jgi:biotin operon repressor
VETVRSLQWVRDRRASFDRSLNTLRTAKALGAPVSKSSLILGLGETEGEVLSAMDELRAAGVDILVMGQYLRPSSRQIPVAEYLSPEKFDSYAEAGRERGFSSVVSAPLARTSYHAREAWTAGKGPVKLEAAGRPEGCKLIRISAEVEGPLIRTLRIRGDFFASPEDGFDRVEERLRDIPVEALGSCFDRLLAEEGVETQGIDGRGLSQVLRSALMQD